MRETPLVGGNVTAGLVRVGDTVRRPAGPWSPSVHHFLTHLADVGFEGAPRSLGFDDRGRHVLEWVAGEVVMPFVVGNRRAAVRRVGRLLRDLHDASVEYVPAADAVWNVLIPPDRSELLVHHDAAPWNLVMGPHRWAFIDWDSAAPGSRTWDLAYAAHGFVPLAPATPRSVAARLLRDLADAYGLTEVHRTGLADALAPRIWSMHGCSSRAGATARSPGRGCGRRGTATCGARTRSTWSGTGPRCERLCSTAGRCCG